MPAGLFVRIALAALVGVAGLFVARERATVITTEHLGVGLFILAVAYSLLLVHRHFDRLDAAAADARRIRGGDGA